MPKNETISLYEGNLWRRRIVIRDPLTKAVRSLSSFKIWFMVKETRDDLDADALIAKNVLESVESGIVLASYTDPTTGQTTTDGCAYVEISGSDYDDLDLGVTYEWDLQIVSPAGDNVTPHEGTIKVTKKDVVKAVG
jgi:hypothetical protein